MKPGAKAPYGEIRARKPYQKIKEFASKIYTPIAETAGMAVGGALGAAGGAFGGPVTAAAGGVAGSGAGNVAGQRFAQGVNRLIGYDAPPPPSALESFIQGAGAELTGGILGKTVQLGSKIHRPSALSGRVAGEELNIAASPKSPEAARAIAERTRRVEAAQRRTGTRLPRASVTGSVRQAALERQRIGKSPDVAEALHAQRIEALRKAEQHVDTTFPHNTKAAETVRSNIEDFNARETQATALKEEERRVVADRVIGKVNTQAAQEAEAKNLAGRSAAEQANVAAEAEKTSRVAQAETSFGQAVPKAITPVSAVKTGTQEFGAEIRGKVQAAEKASMERFNSKETGYPQEKFTDSGEAPAENAVSTYVRENKPPLGFSPTTDVEKKLESLLGGVEREGTDIPPMTYSDLRDVSQASGSAAARARKSGDYDTARYFGELRKHSEAEIASLLEAKSPEVLAEYKNLNALYKSQQIAGFRGGEVANQLALGNESGGVKLAEGAIASHLENPDNAVDLIRAFGIKDITDRGKSLSRAGIQMKQVSEEAILQAGQKAAKEVMKPYFDDRIASIYQGAGGGKTGAKAVERYLRKPETQSILRAYGMPEEYSELARRAKAIGEARAEKVPLLKHKELAPEVIRAAKIQLATNTLKVDDPTKIYSYLTKSGNPKKAFGDLMRVSSSPAYRDSVKELVKDGVKDAIKQRGINPYSKTPTPEEKHLQTLMTQVFNKAERQSLWDFHTIVEAAPSPGTMGAKTDLGIGKGAKELAEGVAAIPMGYEGYWAKHGFLTLINKLGSKYSSAAEKVLDEALIDPAKAKIALQAFKTGETGRFRQLVQKAYDADSIQARILKRLPIAGAVAGYNVATTPEPEEQPIERQKTYGGE
jgi:hypothetical protein